MLYSLIRSLFPVSPFARTFVSPPVLFLIFLPSVLLSLISPHVFAIDRGGVILQYHHVSSTTPALTSISIEHFQQHLDFLEQNKFKVWRLDRLIDALEQKKTIPDKVVSITFDDAYIDIYDNAWPLLKKKKYPFTIFVATELIERKFYLSWEQLKEMQLAGAAIANHTHSHTHLLRRLENETLQAWLSRVRYEITHAQELIELHLGVNPLQTRKLLAYPYGEYNDEILKVVAALDYFGLGQHSGAAGTGSNFLALPRYPLSGHYSDIETFKTKMLTLPMPLQSVQADILLDGSTVKPSVTMTFQPGKYRFDQLTCYGPGGVTRLDRQSETVFVATNITPVPVGRSRYNCTMPVDMPADTPVSDRSRFYWFSQLWIRKNPDGSWYNEP